MKVTYTCTRHWICGAYRREVVVRAREAGEDLAPWMEAMQAAIAADHATLEHGGSCGGMHCDIAIPLPKGNGPVPLGTEEGH